MIDRFHHIFIRPVDYERSLAFYRDTLGWSVTQTWGDEKGGRGAILSGGGMKVVIAERREGMEGEARPDVHLDIHDIDARFKAMPKGDHVVREPEDTHWGTRWFVVRDPDGNVIAFEEVHSRG
ncbi:MAG TPA: VOC family protein [Usitatibacter sp.]|nr:VOC family protein [Usitatibacter sp.]